MPRDYYAELQATAERLSIDAAAAIPAGRAQYEEPLQRLSTLNVACRYLVDRDIVAAAPYGVRVLYGKLADLTSGALICLSEGYPGPAASIFRSHFETAVHLLLILKTDTESRAQLFQDFILVQRSRVPSGRGVTDTQIAENAERLRAVRASYHPTRPHSWCWQIVPSARKRDGVPNNPSLRELCAAIGHPEYYDDLYGHLSDAAHPTPAYEFWLRGPDGSMLLAPKFSHLTHMTANLSSLLVINVLVALLSFLRPPDYDDLLAFLAQLLPKAS